MLILPLSCSLPVRSPVNWEYRLYSTLRAIQLYHLRIWPVNNRHPIIVCIYTYTTFEGKTVAISGVGNVSWGAALKATELGADTIIPMMTQHSIVKVDPQKASFKIERWNKITKDASEQAHRKTKCMVLPIEELHALKFKSYDIVLVAYEKENMSHSLKYILQKKFKNLLIVIGPEGGLSDEEIQFLSGYGNVEFIGLGHRILRSETASSYILSVLNYEYEMIL